MVIEFPREVDAVAVAAAVAAGWGLANDCVFAVTCSPLQAAGVFQSADVPPEPSLFSGEGSAELLVASVTRGPRNATCPL